MTVVPPSASRGTYRWLQALKTRSVIYQGRRRSAAVHRRLVPAAQLLASTGAALSASSPTASALASAAAYLAVRAA